MPIPIILPKNLIASRIFYSLKLSSQISDQNDKLEKRKQYDKQYREKNAERIGQCRKDNAEHRKQYDKHYQKQYYKDHAEQIKKYKQKHKNEHNKCVNEHFKIRWKIDLKFNLNRRMSYAMWFSLKGNKNGRHWEILVGYKLVDLVKRLKKTMPNGYTWQDFLNGKLHIDHKIPKSVFNFNRAEHLDFKRCWALNNLQLLPAKENLQKYNKLSEHFQPSLLL